MRVEFLLEANSELILAADRYDAENPGVGIDFISEVRHAVELILDNNRIGRIIRVGRAEILHEFVLDRFPYSIVYRILANRIVIVAVSHQHRRAGYWRSRVEEPEADYRIPLAA